MYALCAGVVIVKQTKWNVNFICGCATCCLQFVAAMTDPSRPGKPLALSQARGRVEEMVDLLRAVAWNPPSLALGLGNLAEPSNWARTFNSIAEDLVSNTAKAP